MPYIQYDDTLYTPVPHDSSWDMVTYHTINAEAQQYTDGGTKHIYITVSEFARIS